MSGQRENILVRGVNWLGDAVMTTPALIRLREAKPQARITVISPEKLAGLWKDHPALDDVISITPQETVLQVGRRIRWGNFTHGIVFPNSPRSALELWFGRVPQRIGYCRSWRNIFLTEALPERVGKVRMKKRSAGEVKRLITAGSAGHPALSATAHQIHDYLHLVSQLGASDKPVAPQLHVTYDEARMFRLRLLKGVDAGTEFFIGLNAGAEYGPAKRWPKDRFIAAAKAIQKQTNCRWLILGGKNDLELAGEMAGALHNPAFPDHVVTLAGKTSLRELCIALRVCRLLLTNDTGPAHVAAALGTPVVIPFGSTSPDLTSPGLPGETPGRFLISSASCSPCFLRECPIDFRCMTGISPEAVTEAVLQTLKNLEPPM